MTKLKFSQIKLQSQLQLAYTLINFYFHDYILCCLLKTVIQLHNLIVTLLTLSDNFINSISNIFNRFEHAFTPNKISDKALCCLLILLSLFKSSIDVGHPLVHHNDDNFLNRYSFITVNFIFYLG